MPRPRNTLIRVYVIEYGRDKLMLRTVWPDGTQKHESVETTDRKVAERLAALREDELRKEAIELALNGPKVIPTRKTWQDFRDALSLQLLPTFAESTRRKYATVLNAFERHSKPTVEFLDEVTTPKVSEFLAAWRLDGAEEATLFGSLGHFRAALAWGKEQGWLKELPIIRRPRIEDNEPTKGRGITQAEFTKMLKKTKEVVGAEERHWKHAQEGLFLSGLRLGEGINLSWDIPGTIRVDLSGSFPMLDIPRKRQKKRKSELWPITPDFAAFLLKTPASKRTGWVFQFPMPVKNETEFRRVDSISKIISAIGEAAKIVVDEERGKFASAHDFRRSFGIRWAEVLMPAELQSLMRHAAIETTMKFYTRQKSETLAAKIWEKGNISGNTKPKPAAPKTKKPR